MFDADAKDNPLNWSFGVGELFGIHIRIHLFFVLGAAFIIFSSFKDAGSGQTLTAAAESVLTVAILFLIVLLHEFGHCWGSRSRGGEADQIMMWPLGGLASVRPVHTPTAYLITAAAGPMVNVILCAATALVLIILHGGIGAVPWNPLNLFYPVDPTVDLTDSFQKWLRIVFSLSYMLLLFNLVPVYPLDGGRILHSYLWPRKGYRQATLIATFVGMVGAVAMGLVGFATGATLLVVIAVFGYLTCYNDRRFAKHEMAEDGTSEFGYDFSQGFGAFADSGQQEPGYLEKRRQAKEERKQQRETLRQEEHTRAVDEILAKVHTHGMESLTAKEAKILHAETERQRNGT